MTPFITLPDIDNFPIRVAIYSIQCWYADFEHRDYSAILLTGRTQPIRINLPVAKLDSLITQAFRD